MAHTITGDDMTESIWKQHTTLPEFPKLEGDLQTDVLIVGGGLAGLLCAFVLGSRGIEYTLIEEKRILSGVTGNTTAKLTTQHGAIYSRLLGQFGTERAKAYYEANRTGLEQLRKLAKGWDCGLDSRDSFLYTRAYDGLSEEQRALERLGIPFEWAQVPELPFSTEGAITFRDQAQFDPLRFAERLVSGLHIYENTSARQFLGNQVQTDRGIITAQKVIVATHFPILNKHGGYFLKLYQDRSYVIAIENAGALKGMYRDADPAGLSFREADGNILLGGSAHRTGKNGSGWEGLEKQAMLFYPEGRISARWAAQDCISLDGIPYIGRYSPHTPNLYVATGFNKWGMTTSMVSALLLADLVADRENPWTEVFSPQRQIWRKQLFVNAGESAWNLLRPTAPRCPHLGCALRWNARERSWDCPCHGSRFSETGKRLDNPASGDLPGMRDESAVQKPDTQV